MRVFSCQTCGQRTYFDNVRCRRCGALLGYLADRGGLQALEEAGGDDPDVWMPVSAAAQARYRRCANWVDHETCNWMVPVEEAQARCLACQLNEIVPDLTQPGHRELWARLEAAKRRLVYTLLGLGLPVAPKAAGPDAGLAFRFLADPGPAEDHRVMTGHAGGVITINLAEADDAVREQRRTELHKPYRTLVGHFRHESGHYYWERLVAVDEAMLAGFRELFGDEQADYPAAVDRHHRQGPPTDWQDRHVSAYASVHPWEDWAETWAHYLHMVDTLETAEALGVRLTQHTEVVGGQVALAPFDAVLARWVPLTVALNELNRSMASPTCTHSCSAAPR